MSCFCSLVYPHAFSLSAEIIDFCDFLAATDDERALREAAVERVKDVILSIWPACTPTVFGSYATGLFLPTSDMDMVVLESGVDNVPNALRALSLQLSKKRIAKQIQVGNSLGSVSFEAHGKERVCEQPHQNLLDTLVRVAWCRLVVCLEVAHVNTLNVEGLRKRRCFQGPRCRVSLNAPPTGSGMSGVQN